MIIIRKELALDYHKTERLYQKKLSEALQNEVKIDHSINRISKSSTGSSFMTSDEVKYTFYSQVKMLTANIQNTNSAFCYASKLLRLWALICVRCLGLYHFDLFI